MEAHYNDLRDFMKSISNEIASEYYRIQKRTTEDPATAGDQGEENWAELLRKWLPQDYHVVTKGRLMNYKGETSPQVDIIVLKPFYPKYLLNKKLYLTSGVIAVFECKNTLNKGHFEKIISNSVAIRNLFEPVQRFPLGNFKLEMNSPITYGVLAHSHFWKGEKTKTLKIIGEALIREDYNQIKHPRECLDLLCVSDLATWFSYKTPMKMFSKRKNIYQTARSTISWGKIAQTGYGITNTELDFIAQKDYHLIPISGMLSHLYERLSIYDDRLRDFSTYLVGSIGASSMIEKTRKYDHSIFSEDAKIDLELNKEIYETNWYESAILPKKMV